MNTQADLLPLLKEVGALREGHFLLASGRHSGQYVQVAQLSQHPARLQPLLEEALPQIPGLDKVDTVFFPAIGALPVGQQVALALGARAVFTERNAENRMELRRGFELRPGDQVLLVEDVVTTGGTLKEIVGMVAEAGATVAGVFCIINRSGSDTWQGFPLHSLCTLSFPTYAPEEVPPELAKIPIHRPGTKKIS